jgi:Zn-dependent protease
MDFSLLETIALGALPVVFAITLHEAAHGYVARMFGDQTAWMLGRVTLNPLKHIDPVGTVLVPLSLLLVSKLMGGGGFLFGWAKPVPVNFGNLRHPKRDMLWVAAAGPAANFVMAVAWAFVAKLSTSNGVDFMASIGIITNVVLMVLNLFPILPLDGGRIAVSLLPHRLAMSYARLEPYGFMLVILLLVTGALNVLMAPFVNFFLSFFGSLAGG